MQAYNYLMIHLFCIEQKRGGKMGGRRRRWGDRYDGRRLRTLDPFFKIIPYIMKTRSDAQNLFEEEIEVENIEEFLKMKRREGVRNVGLLHVIIAAMVRTIAEKPGLNRFIAGKKIYARNEILISLAVKKQLNERGAETTIKMKFNPEDTLIKIAENINKEIYENKKQDTDNKTDKTAALIMKCPGFIAGFIVWFFKLLDYFGKMPKIINRVSPFHTSVFITDLGSIGIQSIYHHLYEFGTTSLFIAFGVKQKKKIIGSNGEITEKRFVSIKIVTDERIVDGYYYANAFRYFKRLLENPEGLESPPEAVVKDMD